jgi:pantetheine-phosphate adenylyltransferase
MKIGVYPGTFDPITHGHTDIIVRSLRVFDKVIVAVAPNPTKRPLFDLAERLEMVKLVTRGLPHVEVVTFKGLLVDYVQKRKAHAVIRGLRAISLVNRKLNKSVETVFLMPSEEYSYLTSTIIKEVARFGGRLTDFLHPQVAQRLMRRIGARAT